MTGKHFRKQPSLFVLFLKSEYFAFLAVMLLATALAVAGIMEVSK